MKTIKNIIIATFLAVAFTSCENDEFKPVEGTFTETKQVKIGFTDAKNYQAVKEDGGKISFEVSLSEPLPYDGDVTFKVTSSDGSLETTPGKREVTFNSKATISAGQTTAMVELVFANDELDDNYETYTVEIENFKTTQDLKEYSVSSHHSEESKQRKVFVFDVMPEDLVRTTAGEVDIILNWSDASRDMDLYLFKGLTISLSTLIDRSLGFTTTETVTLPADIADNKYGVLVNQYRFTADVDSTVTFKFPNETEKVYSYTVPGLQFVFTLTKITSGNEIIYAIHRL